MPVTNVEVPLTPSTLIVSKTDLKGQITYINRDFLEISGFSESELIGQPHNIVRHPDMPAEAFEDLWQTLKAGRPWIGLVKNRCKNGDYYWVDAHATPLVENGQTVGYMSVRKMPTRNQVDAAEQAYRLFREKRQGNLKVEFGSAVADSLARKLNFFRTMSIKGRLTFVIAMLSLLLIGIGGLGLFGMSKTNEGLQSVYEDRTVALGQVARINRNILRNRMQIDEMLLDPSPEEIAKAGQEIDANIAEINKLWDAYMATKLTPEEKGLAEKFAADRKKFVTEGLKPALEAIRAGNMDQARTAAGAMRSYNAAVGQGVNKLIQLQLDEAKKEYEEAQTRFADTRNIAIGLILAGIALALALGAALIKAIVLPLQQAAGVFGQISQGIYGNRIDIASNNEIGKVLQALEMMQTKLGFDVAETKRLSDENLRIKIALDNVSTGVMIANPDRFIIYANKSVQQILKSAEADIRKQLPDFNAEKLVGVNIDTFHKNPAHQANLLKTFTSTYIANLEIGGRYLRVTASPVLNDQGQRLGAVAEWLDRTPEVIVEQEVEKIVQGALRGDFEQRLALEGKEGFFKQLAEGLNRLAEVTSTGLQDVARVLKTVAQGDLTQTIEADYEGIFGQLKDDTNTTVERLREVIGRIKEATEAINTASQEIAAGNVDLSSRTEEQASSLEETSSSMEELNATVKNNAENAAKANQLAKSSNEIATRGGAMVKGVVSTMSEIQGSSKKIADIIGVIDSIAFQTNILALNAAVEAARAGEQGRGFAVVATEVRNLAHRSATAAKEIKTLIAESVDKVESGAKLVETAGSTMDEVVTSFQHVASLVTEISNASREQSSGIEQVTQAVSQMDEVTQQNAALVEEAAAAAESLEEQARGLMQAVSMFKLTEGNPRGIDDGHALGHGTQVVTAAAKPPRLAAPVRLAVSAPPKPKKIPSPHASDPEDEWEEF
ncbi:MAG: methyl-accepting chemotaxis protein [Sterolibacterium sp.]